MVLTKPPEGIVSAVGEPLEPGGGCPHSYSGGPKKFLPGEGGKPLPEAVMPSGTYQGSLAADPGDYQPLISACELAVAASYPAVS